MKQWEIYDYPFDVEGRHPVVVISNSTRADNPDFEEVNGLFCRSVKADFKPKAFHFLLDAADGLDHATVVRCDHVYVVRREFFGQRIGIVSGVRRLPLYRKIMACFQCPP